MKLKKIFNRFIESNSSEMPLETEHKEINYNLFRTCSAYTIKTQYKTNTHVQKKHKTNTHSMELIKKVFFHKMYKNT